jgi:hypothetical protein
MVSRRRRMSSRTPAAACGKPAAILHLWRCSLPRWHSPQALVKQVQASQREWARLALAARRENTPPQRAPQAASQTA